MLQPRILKFLEIKKFYVFVFQGRKLTARKMELDLIAKKV